VSCSQQNQAFQQRSTTVKLSQIKFLAAAAMLTLSTAALADSQFERTLTASAQPDLYVSTASGEIRIHAGAGDQIHIVGHVHAGWVVFGDVKDRIQRILENPPIAQDGNSVHVGGTNDHGLFDNISIDYDITAPAGAALNLHSASGDIQSAGVGRFVTASAASGSIRLSGVHGAAEVQTASGDIDLGEDSPGNVKARSASGSIHIHGFNGDLTTHTASGEVVADGRLTGPADLSSASGSIRLHLAHDAHFNLEASTGSGSIRVDFPGAPRQSDGMRHHLTAPIDGGGAPLQVHTSSGDIEIDGSGGEHSSVEQNSLRVPGAVDCVAAPNDARCSGD
jgi:hypothetical protein